MSTFKTPPSTSSNTSDTFKAPPIPVKLPNLVVNKPLTPEQTRQKINQYQKPPAAVIPNLYSRGSLDTLGVKPTPIQPKVQSDIDRLVKMEPAQFSRYEGFASNASTLAQTIATKPENEAVRSWKYLKSGAQTLFDPTVSGKQKLKAASLAIPKTIMGIGRGVQNFTVDTVPYAVFTGIKFITDDLSTAKGDSRQKRAVERVNKWAENYIEFFGNRRDERGRKLREEYSFLEPERLGETIGEGSASFLAMIGLAKVSGSKTLASGLVSWIEGADVYNDALVKIKENNPEMDDNDVQSRAAALALGTTAATAALERISLSVFLENVKTPIIGRLTKVMLTEAVTEGTQTASQNIIKKYGYDDTVKIMDGVFESALIGFISGGVTTGGVAGISGLASKWRPKPEGVDPELDNFIAEAERKAAELVEQEANRIKQEVENPAQVDETRQAFQEDVREAVDRLGRDAVVEQLASDATPGDFTPSEARQVVEEAMRSALTDEMAPPDIFADLQAVRGQVERMASAVPDVETNITAPVPFDLDQFIATLPSGVAQEAQETWNAEFEQAYNELSEQLSSIQTELETAREGQKQALEEEQKRVTDQLMDTERRFIRQTTEKADRVKKDEVARQVDKVIQKELKETKSRFDPVGKTVRIEGESTTGTITEIRLPEGGVKGRDEVVDLELPNGGLRVNIPYSRVNPIDSAGESGTVDTNARTPQPSDSDTKRDFRQESDTARDRDGGEQSGERGSSDKVDRGDVARRESSASGDGAGERFSDDVTPAQEAAWSRDYADKAGELETEYQNLRRSLSELKGEDKKKAEAKMNELAKEMAAMEQDFIKKVGAFNTKEVIDLGTEEVVYTGDGVVSVTNATPIAKKQKTKIGQTIVKIIEAQGQVLEDASLYMVVQSQGFMPLGIERLPTNELAVHHSYIQNGDVMFDPEVVFLIDKDGQLIAQTIETSGRTPQMPISPNDSFLTMWAENLESQGFVKEKVEISTDMAVARAVAALKVQYPKGVTLYHQTSQANADKIKQEGFTGEEVFFSLAGYDKSRNTASDNSTVIEIKLPVNLYDQLGLDEGSYYGLSTAELYVDFARAVAEGQTNLDVTLLPDVANKLLKSPTAFAGEVNKTKIKKLEADLRAIYLNAKPELSPMEGYAYVDEVLSNILTSLEIAEAGYRIIIDGEVRGVPSTFPAWIPDNARNRDDLNYAIEAFADVRGFSYPSGRNETKRRGLADALFEELDSQMDVSTEVIRNEILRLYEEIDQTIIDGEAESTTAPSQNDNAGRQEEAISKAGSLGYTPEDLNQIITAATYLTANGQVEFVNGKLPTNEILKVADKWTPAGGRESEGAEGRGLLDEYYTPPEVIDMVKTVLDKMGALKPGMTVLEPSVGTGNFLQIFDDAKVTGYEINDISGRIAKIKHPGANIIVKPFEELFITRGGKKIMPEERYDLVIGNPPYGSHRGKYKGLGEEEKISRYETYFMKRSLDLANNGGYVAMVVPSSFLRSSTGEAGKVEMAKVGSLEQAIRLPNGVFGTTDIGTDLLVFKKNPVSDLETVDQRVKAMSNDSYFQNVANTQYLLGEEYEGSGRFGPEMKVKGTLDSALAKFAESDLGEKDKDAWFKGNQVSTGEYLNLRVYRASESEELTESVLTDFGDGYYFAQLKETAQGYGDKVKEYIINLKNPLVLQNRYEINPIMDGFLQQISEGKLPEMRFREWAKMQGYDGVVVKEAKMGLADDTENNVGAYFVAFNRTQVIEIKDKANQKSFKTEEELNNFIKKNKQLPLERKFNLILEMTGGNYDLAIANFKLFLQTEKSLFHKNTSTDPLSIDGANAWRNYQEVLYGIETAEKLLILTDNSIVAYLYLNKLIPKDIALVYNPSLAINETTPANTLAELTKSENKLEKEIASHEANRRQEERQKTNDVLQKEALKNAGLKVGDKVARFVTDDLMGEIETGKLVKPDGSSQVMVELDNGGQVQWNENWYKLSEDIKPAKVSSQTLDFAQENAQIIKDEQWQYVTATGELAGNFDVAKAFYMAGKYYNKFNYVQGDIYAKLEQLEKDKSKISPDQYKKQKEMLEAVKPPFHTAERMKLVPFADFTAQVEYGNDRDGVPISLRTLFLKWLDTLPMTAFSPASKYDVRDYTVGKAVRGGDKKQNEAARRNRREVGDKLFKLFITEELDADKKAKLEQEYNRRFNSYHKPDYSLVPMVSTLNSIYNKKPLDLRKVQRQGIGFLLNKGVGLLAHDVGLGKTLQGVITNIELIQRGWAKRPLIVVPSISVYKQWVSDFKQLKPEIKLNELSNLGGDFKGDLQTLVIPENSISIVTEEGFKKLGFTDATYQDLTQDLQDALENPNNKTTKRQAEKQKAKTEETVGKGMRGIVEDRTFESMGFDAITVDEIHNYNHIFESAKDTKKDSEFRGFTQTASVGGIKLWLAAQYILKNNNNRNVIGLSATPFTNHPLEYYSIMSLFARKRMTEMGISNVNDFMSMFMDIQSRDEVTPDGKDVKAKLAVRGFNNARQFQALLREVIDFRDGEAEGIIRPNRNGREYTAKENQLSYEYKQLAMELFQDENAGTLKAMTELQKIAFSPYISKYHRDGIPGPKQFVEGSPKIKLAMKLLLETYRSAPDSNHLVYTKQGTDSLPVIRQYLIEEGGIPENQVAIITGKTAKNKRSEIQNDFNAGKIRVVLGNEAIEEGINLQMKTTDLYMLSQPWNFTAVRQIIGRAWRQGNEWKNVRVNQFFTENTFDVYLAQTIEKKRVRYEQSLQTGLDYIDAGDIDYEALKFALITDPVLRTRLQFVEKGKKLEADRDLLQADFAQRNRRAKDYVEAYAKLIRTKEFAKNYPKYKWAEENVLTEEKKVATLKATLADKGIDVASFQVDLNEMESKLKAINEQIENLKVEEEAALQAAKEEARLMSYTAEQTDFSGILNERKEDDRRLFLNPNAKFSLANTLRDTPNNNKLDRWRAEAAKYATKEEFLAAQTYLYHGTLEDFKSFDINYAGTNTQKKNSSWGIFFSDEPRRSNDFVKMASPHAGRPARLIKAVVDIKKPLDITINGLLTNGPQAVDIIKVLSDETLSEEEAKELIDQSTDMGDIADFYNDLYTLENKAKFEALGYDGMIAEMGRDDGKVVKEYVAWRNEQIITEAELAEIWDATTNPKFSRDLYTRDKKGRFARKPTPAELEAMNEELGLVKGADPIRAKKDRVYQVRMTASNATDALQIIKKYAKQFNIEIPVEVVDRIFSNTESLKNNYNILQKASDAYGVYVADSKKVYFSDTQIPKLTAHHEFIHFVLDNLMDVHPAFKGSTRLQVMEASLKDLKSKGKLNISKTVAELEYKVAQLTRISRNAEQDLRLKEINETLVAIEENLAYGYEEHLVYRALEKKAREAKYGTIIAKFLEALDVFMRQLHRSFKTGKLNEVYDFYEKVRTGQGGEVTMKIAVPPKNRALYKHYTPGGEVYLDFEHTQEQLERDRAAARRVYYMQVTGGPDKEFDFATNQVWENQEKKNLVMKDLNWFEDATAQMRDIYLKDETQFKPAKDLEQVAEMHDADKAALDNKLAEALIPYFKLPKERRPRLNEILWRGDEMGKRFNDAELIRMSLDEDQVEAYNAVRNSLDMAHEMLLLEMQRKGIDENEIEAFRRERDGYMPHKWIPKMTRAQKAKYYFDKNIYVVKTQVKKNGQWSTYHMDAFASEKEALANRLESEKKAEEAGETSVRYLVDQLSSLEVDFFSSQDLTTEKMVAVIEQMRAEGYVKDRVLMLLKENLVNMFKEKGFGRHYLRRTGVRGYDTENTERILADYFSGFSGYLTKMRWSNSYFNVLSKVDARRQSKFFAWVRDTIAYKLNNSREFEFARNIAFTWFLANDLSYLITNSTQNWIVGVGEMSKYFTGGGKAYKPETYLVKATTDWWAGNVTAEERMLIEGLLERGQLGAEMNAELMGFKNNPLYREIGAKFNIAMFKSTAVVEQHVNRIPAFLAMYRAFKEMGYNQKQASEKSLEVSNDIHFRYGLQHRPKFLRGPVNVLFIFMHYIRSFLYQLHRDVSRREYVAFTRKMMYTVLIGGTTALPFAKLLIQTFGSIFSDDEDEEMMAEMNKWEIAITRGIPATFGIDMSQRVGIELLMINRMADNPSDIRTYMGPMGDLLFTRPFSVAAMLEQERYLDATAKTLPDMAAGPLRAYLGYTVGVRSQAGVPLIDPNGDVYKYNGWEATLRAMNFTPTMENLLWEDKSKEWQKNDKAEEERTQISRTIRGMLQRGEFDKAIALQERAVSEGIINERTDYVRQFAKADYFKEAVAAWNTEPQSRTALKAIEDKLIEQVYRGEATDLQRNNIRRELAVYRQFGMDNPDVTAIMKATSNKQKVQILSEIEEALGPEQFRDFVRKGRSTITTEKGNPSAILISDNLWEEYQKNKKASDAQ